MFNLVHPNQQLRENVKNLSGMERRNNVESDMAGRRETNAGIHSKHATKRLR